MQSQQEQRPFEFLSFEAFLGWSFFLARTLAATTEVFLHRWETFGDRYLGWQAVAALPLLLFFPVVFEGHGAEAFICYLALYVAMCACIRIRLLRRRWCGGQLPHSFYTGTPRIGRWFPWLSETYVKSSVEPSLVALIALLFMFFSVPLGVYLLVAAFGQAAAVQVCVSAQRLRVLDLNDAFLEQRQVAERFRGMRGD